MKLTIVKFPVQYAEFLKRADSYMREVLSDPDYMPTECGMLNFLGFSLIDYNNFMNYVSNPNSKDYVERNFRGKYGEEMLGKAWDVVETINTLKCWAYAVFQERFTNSNSYEMKNYAKSSRLGTMRAD